MESIKSSQRKLWGLRYRKLDNFMATLDHLMITDGEHVVGDSPDMAHLIRISFDDLPY